MLEDQKISLFDLLGEEYCDAVKKTAAVLHGVGENRANELIQEPVHCHSSEFVAQQEELTEKTGSKVVDALRHENPGAATESFQDAANLCASPIGGVGAFRVGEDGRLYLIVKSEHYHTPLGHNFAGYRLIDRARALGISNATHNNTRGYITRKLEREIIRTINGIAKGDEEKLQRTLLGQGNKTLCRVINLETGSLAVEAGIKMMLNRFYSHQNDSEKPEYAGKVPVFFVMADREGGPAANYHGTTVITQTMRGMWPKLYEKAENADLYKVVGVHINDAADFEKQIKQYNSGKYKTAGFLHEIVLMNYGGIRLDKAFLQTAYRLCEEYDTPVLADEIQSCMWYSGMYLHRLYGLHPDFVILGKGFSGGEYPASKIVTTANMDSLSQFGALVTNGQQELASLSYLVTMAFAEANADNIHAANAYFENALTSLAKKYENVIEKIEGLGHLAAIHFHDVDTAVRFTELVNGMCIDIGVQTYKASCPPAALLKPPLILSEKTMDFLCCRMEDAIKQILTEENE